MTTTIHISDETYKAAVEAGLWQTLLASQDGLHDEIWECVNHLIDTARTGDVPSVSLDARLGKLAALRQEIERLRCAEIGQDVQLAVAPAALAEQFRDLRNGIKEDEGFWDKRPSERARMMEMHDVLDALADSLGAVEAVA